MCCLTLPEGGDMYFVHSYAFRTLAPADCLAVSEYGMNSRLLLDVDCVLVFSSILKKSALGSSFAHKLLGMTSC